jgi:beta-galactosidase
MNLDGSVGPKAEMAGKVARWANAHPAIWKSMPVQGEIGIVWVPESMIFNQLQLGSAQFYAEAVRGAYQGFFDQNIQADFVSVDHIGEYPLVYLPYPVMLKEETAKKLMAYVENGGQLVSEGLPGYFAEGGHVGEVQPNLGLHKLFGAREKYVEFTPDLLEDLTLEVQGKQISGRYYLQEYALDGGNAVGTYQDGAIAAVENEFGKGRTLLVGSFPGAGYFLHHTEGTRRFFGGLLEWGDVTRHIISSDPEVKVRLHKGSGGNYLWVVNPERSPREVKILMNADVDFSSARDLWGGDTVISDGKELRVTVDDRDAAVILLNQ